MAFALVALLRLGVPLFILRFPVWGAFAAMGADFIDFHIFEALHWSGLAVEHYQLADKLFDTYYLGLELRMALKWRNRLLRDTAVALFIWRMAGVAWFTWSGQEEILFLAPNIFEWFYLLVAVLTAVRPRLVIRRAASVSFILMLLAVPKFMNEYILHVRKTSTIAFLKERLPSVNAQAAAPKSDK